VVRTSAGQARKPVAFDAMGTRNPGYTSTYMSGLDLLLNYSPFSELMHQLVLACLLKDVAVTRALGLPGAPQSTDIERQGRLFDITVVMEGGKEVRIELKLDAVLGRDQLQRQRENIEASQQEMLYIVLGGTQFVMSGDDIVATWTGGYTQSLEITDDGSITPGPIILAYSTVSRVLQLREVIASLSSASPEIANSAVRELADAYRRCLEKMRDTFASFRETSIRQWTNAHWNGFYDYVRSSLFPSATISNRFGQPKISWGSRDLDGMQIAVDDFFEYGVHVESEENSVSIKLDVVGTYDEEHTRGVRADFARSLQSAADLAGLELVFTTSRVGKVMTVAQLAGGYLTTKSSNTLDWNYASGILRRIDSAVDDAVKLFRKNKGRT
jgi:hypothetical protein